MEDIDIIASGILQAVQRGETKSKATQTFLNAGYSRDLVARAAKKVESMGQGVASVPSYPVVPSKQRPRQQPTSMPMPTSRRVALRGPAGQGGIFPAKKPRGGSMLTWIVIFAVVIVTIFVNGFLIWKFVLGS